MKTNLDPVANCDACYAMEIERMSLLYSLFPSGLECIEHYLETTDNFSYIVEGIGISLSSMCNIYHTILHFEFRLAKTKHILILKWTDTAVGIVRSLSIKMEKEHFSKFFGLSSWLPYLLIVCQECMHLKKAGAEQALKIKFIMAFQSERINIVLSKALEKGLSDACKHI